MDTLDYRKYYYLEEYLFREVGPRFAEQGTINPIDFYMIIIWKSNRAKTRVRDQLRKRAPSFAAAVKKISTSLQESQGAEEKLRLLMEGWGLRLPMASAILTVLYPDDFTIYDFRVCEALKDFTELAWRRYSRDLWEDYRRFVETVRSHGPADLILRDRDRYLWGYSFYSQVKNEVEEMESETGSLSC